MTMNTRILIVGAHAEDRTKKAYDIASEGSSREDILFFDATKNRGIAPTKEFLSKLAKKPYTSPILTAILSEAQNLTTEAQNSLLKILEEPGKQTQIILTASSAFALLSTISSRCQKIYLTSSKEIKKGLPLSIVEAELSQRLDLAEKLDLAEWVQFLHEKFKLNLRENKISSHNLVKLVKYLKFVEKINSQKAQVNPKLVRYLTVLGLPKELSDTLA